MAEQLDILAHVFEFIEDNRALIAFSGEIRLDPKRHLVELKRNATTGKFPTSGEHYVISPLFQPKGVRQWVGFEAVIAHAKEGPDAVTDDGFRLHDGTNHYWWDGAAWVVNALQWNTEGEIANNIASFPVTARKLRVVVRLTTTDGTVSPVLKQIKVAFKAKVQYLEDIVYRVLAPALRNIRYIVDFAYKVPFPGGGTLDLNPMLAGALMPFNVVDANAIFNNNTDPEQTTNLLTTYNPSTKIATLASPIPVGNFAIVQLVVEPEVSIISSSVDYTEVEKVPAIQITEVESVNSSRLAQDESVVNKSSGAALRIRAPYRFDLRFTMIALSPGGKDALRLAESVVGYLDNNPTIRSAALDRTYRIMMLDEFRSTTRPNSRDLHASQATFVVKDVLAWKRATANEYAVTSLKLRGDANIDVDAPVEAPSVPVFTPADVPTLQAWYRADQGVSLISGRVSQWNDLSGNGRHLVQSLVNNRPQMGVSIGGQQSVAFDFGPDVTYMSFPAAYTQSDNFIIVAVVRRGPGNLNPALVTPPVATSPSPDATWDAPAFMLGFFNPNQLKPGVWNGKRDNWIKANIDTDADYNPHIYRFHAKDAGAYHAAAIDALPYEVMFTAGHSSTRNVWAAVGAWEDEQGSIGPSDVAELMIFGSPGPVLTVDEETALMNYLTERYGL